MAEQFHEWVGNLSWWERLYYELFDPSRVHCTTNYIDFPFGIVLIGLVCLVCVSVFALWWLRKVDV